MIPFGSIFVSIRADDSMLGCDLVPLLSFRAAWSPDPIHVNGKSVGVQ
jgi:hypothetical protein